MNVFGTRAEDFGLPPEAFDQVEQPEEEIDRSYVDVLTASPAWQTMEERLSDDAAAMIQKLLAMKPLPATNERPEQSLLSFAADLISQIAEIRGVLRVLEEPVVIRRAIDARRDR